MRYGFKELWWNFRIKQHSGIDLSYCFEQKRNKLNIEDRDKSNIHIEFYKSNNINVVYVHNLYRASGKTTSFIRCCNDYQYTHRPNKRLYIGFSSMVVDNVKRKMLSPSENDAFPFSHFILNNLGRHNYTLVFIDDLDFIKRKYLPTDREFILRQLQQICDPTKECLALIIH